MDITDIIQTFKSNIIYEDIDEYGISHIHYQLCDNNYLRICNLLNISIEELLEMEELKIDYNINCEIKHLCDEMYDYVIYDNNYYVCDYDFDYHIYEKYNDIPKICNQFDFETIEAQRDNIVDKNDFGISIPFLPKMKRLICNGSKCDFEEYVNNVKSIDERNIQLEYINCSISNIKNIPKTFTNLQEVIIDTMININSKINEVHIMDRNEEYDNVRCIERCIDNKCNKIITYLDFEDFDIIRNNKKINPYKFIDRKYQSYEKIEFNLN